MIFIKMKHIHTSKLIKISNDWTYDDYKKIAIKKFPELEEGTFYFTDNCKTILDEEVLVDYINHNLSDDQPKEIIILRHHNRSDSIASRSTSSIVSVDNIPLNDTTSFYCDNIGDISISSVHDTIEIDGELYDSMEDDTDVITNKENYPANLNEKVVSNIESTPSTSVQARMQEEGSAFANLSLDDWKTTIINRGGLEIFNECEEKHIISNRLRVKLVNIMCSILVEKYGIKVPGYEKEYFASIIIKLIPGLRDPMGRNGHEAFYTNSNGGEGYIAWRLRTIARNHYRGEIIRKRKNKSPVETHVDSRKKPVTLKTVEITEALEYLRNASPNDTEGILEKMAVTYEYRRNIGQEIWKEFPRFEDLPFLIENDFQLAGYNNNFEAAFERDIDKILNIYTTTVKHLHIGITHDGVKGWGRSIRAIFALDHMLPPAAARRNKNDTKKAYCLEDLIIIFKSINTPISEVIAASLTKQPFLLAQGYNKASISQYNLIIDGKCIPCPSGCTGVRAFANLFMAHFVFNVQYEEILTHFWEFIQSYYFEINNCNIKFTPKMIELRSRLQNVSM